MKKQNNAYNLYTIEFGYIDTDKEKYCLNETNYIDIKKYQEDLVQYLKRTLKQENNINGYYIECYCDTQKLLTEDLFELKEYKTITDCALKSNMIANYMIDFSGSCIDYVYK